MKHLKKRETEKAGVTIEPALEERRIPVADRFQYLIPAASGRKSRFPFRVYLIVLIAFLCASGIHTGLLIVFENIELSSIIETHVILLFWVLAALGVTIYVRHQIRIIFEQPLQELADAADQVASGDFSVYVTPQHTEVDDPDYLDRLILNFDKMVEELGSIETLKVDFFSNVSHEIKTPIAVIQNTAELMQKEDLTAEEREEYLNTIMETTRKLSSLITNILKLNKLEKQAIVPNGQSYDLCEQLVDCALQFESIWEKKNIEFEADLQDDTCEITADSDLLSLVWNNLLSNAMKFTEPGGTVSISEHKDGENVIVSVSDSGCGMSEETVRHIYEKFYQGDTSHSTEGNGLGLALAVRVLELSGGRIAVESKVGEGSTFTVTIPVGTEEK